MKQLIVAVIILVASNCFAEPSSTTQYLINEPVSMMDFGLIKIERELKEWALFKGRNLEIVVSYSWDKDLLIIEVYYDITEEYKKNKEFYTTKTIKGTCRMLITEAGAFLKINVPSSFVHNGYHTKKQPADLIKDLSKKILTKVQIYWRDETFTEIPLCKCESLLTEKRILFESIDSKPNP